MGLKRNLFQTSSTPKITFSSSAKGMSVRMFACDLSSVFASNLELLDMTFGILTNSLYGGWIAWTRVVRERRRAVAVMLGDLSTADEHHACVIGLVRSVGEAPHFLNQSFDAGVR
jgi:hypothetical protein